MEGHSCLWSKVVLIAHVWTGGCPLHLPNRKLRKWPFLLDEAGGAWWLPSPEVAVTVHKLANANLVAYSLETCNLSIWIISQQNRLGEKKGLQPTTWVQFNYLQNHQTDGPMPTMNRASERRSFTKSELEPCVPLTSRIRSYSWRDVHGIHVR